MVYAPLHLSSLDVFTCSTLPGSPPHAVGALSAGAVLDALPAPHLVVDARGRLVAFNPSCAEAFGCLEQHVGTTLLELPGPWQAEPLRAHLAALPVGTLAPTTQDDAALHVYARPLTEELVLVGLRPPDAAEHEAPAVQETLEFDTRRCARIWRRLASNATSTPASCRTSPTSPRTTCRSRCAKSTPSPTCCSRTVTTDLGADGQHYVERLRAASQRMSRLISDLLAFSRVQTERAPFQPVDLQALLTTARGTWSEAFAAASGTITVPAAAPTLRGDARHLALLVRHLVQNALKFRRPDVPPRLSVHALVDDAALKPVLHLVFEDNGIGFEQKYAERVFKPFERLHGRDAYEEGTGIGLALCRRIVEQHGGHIVAESTPGKGTRVLVALPLDAEAEAALPSAVTDDGERRRG